MIHRNPGLADVLDLFDKTAFPEKEYNGSSLDDIFHRIEMLFPECYAAREYFSWRAMPEKTAASVRATLKGALNAVFPEDIRNMMKDKPQVDFQKLGSKKMALFHNGCRGTMAGILYKSFLVHLHQTAEENC